MKRILFVEDELNVLKSLHDMPMPIKEAWEMALYMNPEQAWSELSSQNYDVAVLYLESSGINDLKLLDRIKENEPTQKIPVVIITKSKDGTFKRKVLEHGAVDLLSEPIDPEDLAARINSALFIKTKLDALELQNKRLEGLVRQRTSELIQAHREIVWRMGKFAEERDKKSGNHVLRVGLISNAVAEAMGLDAAFVETIGIAAPLHDIGKIAVSDYILFKKGSLTKEETTVMRRHCWLGARILRGDLKFRQAFEQWQDSANSHCAVADKNPFLEMAAAIAMSHHEKWDGTGYPRNLIGEDIPLEARITAIADVFDTLTSDIPYRPAYSEEWALDWIRDNAGTHFDPSVYAAFLKALPKIQSVTKHFSDSENESGGPNSDKAVCDCDLENALEGSVCISPLEIT
jgi:response regulator RpfG family c-di-GMP phosphodiesterase